MSEFAFFRFLSYNLLTEEEKENKEEIINLTEEVLDAKGLECDSRISKLSREEIEEILKEVRKKREKKKKTKDNQEIESDSVEQVTIYK
ncbi:MAG: hypothetical protein MRJ93_12625 [Nitrososphaeraceae archaeon]|nr:hypothetical protein [Nitrososphaeraceae archaeon]